MLDFAHTHTHTVIYEHCKALWTLKNIWDGGGCCIETNNLCCWNNISIAQNKPDIWTYILLNVKKMTESMEFGCLRMTVTLSAVLAYSYFFKVFDRIDPAVFTVNLEESKKVVNYHTTFWVRWIKFVFLRKCHNNI